MSPDELNTATLCSLPTCGSTGVFKASSWKCPWVVWEKHKRGQQFGLNEDLPYHWETIKVSITFLLVLQMQTVTIKSLAGFGNVHLWLTVPPAPCAVGLGLDHRAELLRKDFYLFSSWSLIEVCEEDTILTPEVLLTLLCLQQEQRCHMRSMAAYGGCPVPTWATWNAPDAQDIPHHHTNLHKHHDQGHLDGASLDFWQKKKTTTFIYSS